MPAIRLFVNRTARTSEFPVPDFAGREKVEEVLSFHRAIPGYEPTPLIDLKGLARELGVSQIFIKDESYRFGLNAFKGLGASYAIAKTLGITGLERQTLDLTLVTATDGNHGRAVAWVAEQLGIEALVFIPDGANPSRVRAIRAHGAEVVIGGVNYEAAIGKAVEASRAADHLLVQDTAWDGYETIPELITQGYFTLVNEFAEQQSGRWPTHVFIQAGVGSLAAGIIGGFCSFQDQPVPKFIIVEPSGAACVYESARRGGLYTIEGKHETIMDCLSCGRASTTAWEIMHRTADAFLACDDEITVIGKRVLSKPYGEDPPVYSGESGAVTTGALYELIRNPKHSATASELGLDVDSVILLFSTEGRSEGDAVTP